MPELMPGCERLPIAYQLYTQVPSARLAHVAISGCERGALRVLRVTDRWVV